MLGYVIARHVASRIFFEEGQKQILGGQILFVYFGGYIVCNTNNIVLFVFLLLYSEED